MPLAALKIPPLDAPAKASPRLNPGSPRVRRNVPIPQDGTRSSKRGLRPDDADTLDTSGNTQVKLGEVKHGLDA
jgi:hypothetical protein